MNNQRFSSRNFSDVASKLETPDNQVCLLHERVRKSEANDFSVARKHEVHIVELPSRALSMTFGALKPLQASGLHRHNYETMIYIISGAGFSMIGEARVAWAAGDAIYIPVWEWHRHVNTSETAEATYIACENTPLLQTLGIALREEA